MWEREPETETGERQETCHEESERSAEKRNRFRERPAEPSLECD